MAGSLLLSGCTALGNDFDHLDDVLAYGKDTEAYPSKVDEKPDYGKRNHKVNAYMWRASLHEVGTLPLLTSDAHQGVIETDWYASPEDPTERRKIRVAILGAYLRRDMLRVTIDRQVQGPDGWTTAPVMGGLAQKYEDRILEGARDLYDQ